MLFVLIHELQMNIQMKTCYPLRDGVST